MTTSGDAPLHFSYGPRARTGVERGAATQRVDTGHVSPGHVGTVACAARMPRRARPPHVLCGQSATSRDVPEHRANKAIATVLRFPTVPATATSSGRR